MLFNSLDFLILCLVTLGLYYLPLGKVWQVSVLLVASAVFYAWEEPRLLFLLGASCLLNAVAVERILFWKSGGGRREAMRLGCVIISAPLPPNRFYKDSPIIQLDDWSELTPLLGDLRQNPEKLMQHHVAMVNWWDTVCCEEATACWMESMISDSYRQPT